MLKIDAGIPIPEKGRKDKGYTTTLRSLEVGQSVVIPSTRVGSAVLAQRALGAGNYTSRRWQGGYRIWRTK